MRLNEICSKEELNNKEEVLWHFLPEAAEETNFATRVIVAEDIPLILTPMGDMSVLQAFEDLAEDEQRELVEWKMANFDEERTLVVMGQALLDG